MRGLFGVLVLLVSLGTTVLADEGKELFNGKDLDGWVAEGAKDLKDASGATVPVWSVRDGLLHCEGKGFGFLRYSKQEYGDFRLHVKYRMNNKGCNSGIGIRTRDFD